MEESHWFQHKLSGELSASLSQEETEETRGKVFEWMCPDQGKRTEETVCRRLQRT